MLQREAEVSARDRHRAGRFNRGRGSSQDCLVVIGSGGVLESGFFKAQQPSIFSAASCFCIESSSLYCCLLSIGQKGLLPSCLMLPYQFVPPRLCNHFLCKSPQLSRNSRPNLHLCCRSSLRCMPFDHWGHRFLLL